MRVSLPSFAAGAVAAALLAAVPATAVVIATADARPTAFDGTSPTLTMGPVEFVVGASIDAAATPSNCEGENMSVPLRMRWSGGDTTSGLSGFDVWGWGEGFEGVKKLAEGTQNKTFGYSGANWSSACGGGDGRFDERYWVVAKDNRGNTATTNLVGQQLEIWQETGAGPHGQPGLPLTRTGTWRTASCTCFNNGTTLYSTAVGASLSYQVRVDSPGQSVAVVVEKAANRGSVNISVDGGTPTAVSTYASTATHRVIVWQRSLSVGTHTVKVTNAGTAGRSRVDVDAILRTLGPTGESPPELQEATP